MAARQERDQNLIDDLVLPHQHSPQGFLDRQDLIPAAYQRFLTAECGRWRRRVSRERRLFAHNLPFMVFRVETARIIAASSVTGPASARSTEATGISVSCAKAL